MVNNEKILDEQLQNVKHAISMMQSQDGKPIDIIADGLQEMIKNCKINKN